MNMAKRVFIIHGWSGSPLEAWIPWLKAELQKEEFRVSAPSMPDPDRPRISTWVKAVGGAVGRPDGDTFFVGHSIGCQTILRYLQAFDEVPNVGGNVLVAPWTRLTAAAYGDAEDRDIANEWLNTAIQWERLSNNRFITIFSDNDPLVPLSEARVFMDKLRAKVIIKKKAGHLGGESGIKMLPEALRSVLEMASTHKSL